MSKASWRQKTASSYSGIRSNRNHCRQPRIPDGPTGDAPGPTASTVRTLVVDISSRSATIHPPFARLEIDLTHDLLRGGHTLHDLCNTALLQGVHAFTDRCSFDGMFALPRNNHMPHRLTHTHDLKETCTS